MLSEVPYGAFLVYAPRGTSEASRKAQDAVKALKQNKRLRTEETTAEYVARRMRELATSELRLFLEPDALLVPAPGHARRQSGPLAALWPALEIAVALKQFGFGQRVEELLERESTVTKSAFASASERPTPQVHYESLRARASLERPRSVTVVDDVVTKGATLLACASRIAEALPGVPVRCFAVYRVVKRPEIVDQVEPCVDRIELLPSGKTRRFPWEPEQQGGLFDGQR